MIATLLAFLAKIGIGTIATKIADAYQTRQAAATDVERIAADERIKTLEAKRDVLIAEARSPLNQLMRALFVIPPGVYLAKLFIIDKVLGVGTTDPLSPTMENVLWTVVGFLFLQDAFGRRR